MDTTALVKRAITGDTTAFHRLVDGHQDGIFRMVYYRTRSRQDAEDLTQDVFLKAYRHLKRLKKPERFKGWLFRIAANRVRDHLRKQRFRGLFRTSADPVDAEETAAPADAAHLLQRRQFWECLHNILDGLAPREKEVFMLRFMDGLSLAEIAQVMNKGLSTVKTHLYRGIKKIRRDPRSRELWEQLAECGF
jgi:RNA polymerase sigma-70 factor (ECF subfamily)